MIGTVHLPIQRIIVNDMGGRRVVEVKHKPQEVAVRMPIAERREHYGRELTGRQRRRLIHKAYGNRWAVD